MTPLRQLKNQKIYRQLSLSPISRFMFLLLWNIEENLGFFSIWLAARKLEPCQLMDAVFWWRFPRQKYGKLESKITGNKRHRQKKMSSSNIFTPNLILHPMKNENDDMIWKPTFLGKIRVWDRFLEQTPFWILPWGCPLFQVRHTQFEFPAIFMWKLQKVFFLLPPGLEPGTFPMWSKHATSRPPSLIQNEW